MHTWSHAHTHLHTYMHPKLTSNSKSLHGPAFPKREPYTISWRQDRGSVRYWDLVIFYTLSSYFCYLGDILNTNWKYIHSSIQICEVSWCYSRPTPVLECGYCWSFCQGCKNIGILSVISYKIPPHVLVNLYYSLIYPYWTYCNMIWSSTYTSRLTHLVILQKKQFA